MPDRDLTELFLRYRSHRDAADLARVFDALAPGLLLLASHLLPEPADAEDCLQRCFLVAIEQADGFDPARQPLRHWLAGILVNRCKELHRHPSRRRRAADARALHERRSTEPGPDAAASHRELLDAVQGAVDDLPETYRHVLILRLVHGLGPTEIAHSLGKAPETVRTQLHRGLQQLRGKLPKGLATMLAGMLATTPGLAAVRRRVLRAAAGETSLVAGTAAGGIGLRLLLPAILTLVLLAWAASTDPGSVHADPMTTAASLGQPTIHSGTEASPPPETRRAALPEPAAKVRGDWSLSGRITDRDERSIPGARVCVRVLCRPLRERRLLGETRSRADGHYSFDLEALRARSLPWLLAAELEVEVQVDGCLPKRETCALATEIPGAQLRRRCDVQVRDGMWVAGRVLDEDGTPVAGVEVMLSGSRILAKAIRQVETDDQGSFLLGTTHPGRYRVYASSRSNHLVGQSEDFDLETPGRNLPPLKLQAFGSARQLAGRVCFPDGRPVAHLPLLFQYQGMSGGTVRGETDREGKFCVPGIKPGQWRLLHEAVGSRSERLFADTAKPDNRIVLPCAVLRIRARTADGRPAPVLGGQLRLFEDAAGQTPRQTLSSAASHALKLVPKGLGIGVELEAGQHLVATGFCFTSRWDHSLELVYRPRQPTARIQLQARPDVPVDGLELSAAELVPIGTRPGSGRFEVLERRADTWLLAVEPGQYLLTPQATQVLPCRHPLRVEVGAGQHRVLSWQPRLGGHLTLFLRSPQGERMITGLRVTRSARAARRRRVEVVSFAEQGQARFGRALHSELLPPGRYRIAAFTTDHQPAGAEIEIRAGARRELHLNLLPK